MLQSRQGKRWNQNNEVNTGTDPYLLCALE